MILTRSTKELLPVIFHDFAAELRPLIDVDSDFYARLAFFGTSWKALKRDYRRQLFLLFQCSIKLHTIQSGWSSVYIEWSHAMMWINISFPEDTILFSKNSADPYWMLRYVVFHLEVFTVSNLHGANPFKPSVLFMWHWQTVLTQIRRHRTRRLIRVSTVCLHNVLLKGVLASVPTHGFSLNFA